MKNENVFEGDLSKANFPDRYFDLVTLYNVLEHTHNPQESLKEIRRILKDGGFLAIQVPNINSWQLRIFKKNWAAVDVPRDLYYFNPDLLGGILKKERFSDFSVDYFNSWWHPPTFTISLFPWSAPQFFWQDANPAWKSIFNRSIWALVTLTIAPVFTFFEQLFRHSAIVTVYARKS